MLDKKRWTPAEAKARDHFAGLAMQELMRSARSVGYDYEEGYEKALSKQRREIVKRAYQMADDMLQQRAHAFYDHEA